MTINPNLVGVPAQSKNLDTAITTTTAGLVHRQIISIADPETATSYARVSGDSLQVSVQNASVAVTAASLPLPTGASTATLQTTGNTSLNSIDTKTPALSGGRVPVESNLVQGLTDTQLRASAVPVSAASLPLPTGAATESTLVALSAKVVNGYSFHHSASNATTTIKSGAGVLKRVTVNTLGSALNTCTIYDNTAGSGTIIAVIDPTLARAIFEYDLVFNTGLTIVTATGTAADLTIVYQ